MAGLSRYRAAFLLALQTLLFSASPDSGIQCNETSWLASFLGCFVLAKVVGCEPLVTRRTAVLATAGLITGTGVAVTLSYCPTTRVTIRCSMPSSFILWRTACLGTRICNILRYLAARIISSAAAAVAADS